MRPGRPRGSSRRRLIAALLLLALGHVGCAGWTGDGRPVLRVGAVRDSEPLLFEREGEWVGIEADLVHAVAESLGRKVEFRPVPDADPLAALERGEVDVVIGGLTESVLADSDRARATSPFLQAGQLALIRRSDVGRFGRLRRIYRPGTRVGYERGRSGERFVADRLFHAEAFGFESLDEALRSLRAGRIDYLVHDAPTIWRLAGDPAHLDLIGLYRPLEQDGVVWAMRKGDEGLYRRIDTTLSHWRREGRIEPILGRWIPVRVHHR